MTECSEPCSDLQQGRQRSAARGGWLEGQRICAAAGNRPTPHTLPHLNLRSASSRESPNPHPDCTLFILGGLTATALPGDLRRCQMPLTMAPSTQLFAGSPGVAAGARCSQNGVGAVRPHPRATNATRLQPQRAAATDSAAAANGSHQPVRPDTSAAALLNAFEGLDGGGSKQLRDFCEIAYLSGRTRVVQDHFPGALGATPLLGRKGAPMHAA